MREPCVGAPPRHPDERRIAVAVALDPRADHLVDRERTLAPTGHEYDGPSVRHAEAKQRRAAPGPIGRCDRVPRIMHPGSSSRTEPPRRFGKAEVDVIDATREPACCESGKCILFLH